MEDSTATGKPTVPDSPVAKPDWMPSIAGKRLAWGLGKYTAAKVTAVVAAPAALEAFNAAAAKLQPMGITLVIQPDTFRAMLPAAMFAALVIAHDYAKVKLGARFL